MTEHNTPQINSGKSWYDKHYKFLLAIALALMFATLAYLLFFYIKHGDIMYKDVSLTGGTTITIYSPLTPEVKKSLPKDSVIREISDLKTGKPIAFSIETTEKIEDIESSLEKKLGYNLTEENSSVEFTGAALSESFYNELRIALVIAFALMAIVVFVMFRTFIPSIAVLQAGFTDIIVSLAFVNLIGFRVSGAGIAAFLMLIGYSVDTDIMLTNRALRKGEQTLNKRLKSALYTGLTMTLTSLAAVFLAWVVVRNISSVLSEIFMILSVGLVADIFSTWLGNAAILKWYCERKRIL